MAELSSNWKKLQATLQKPSKSAKRPSSSEYEQLPKKPRLSKLNTNRSNTQSKALPTSKMGGVQSSKPAAELPGQASPSTGLWASQGEVSSEALADAYKLGVNVESFVLNSRNDRVNHGLSGGIELGKYIAVDCEMVGVGAGGYESALARVSLVDFHGRQIYDSFVKPKERVTDWRTSVSGVSLKEMRFARDFEEVQQTVSDLFRDRILIGHDIKHDMDALKLSHPLREIRDTARYAGFKRYGHGRKPALRNLARELLGIEIQESSHSSTEDARAAMLLFRKHKPGFDVDHANRYTLKPAARSTKPSKKGKGSRGRGR